MKKTIVKASLLALALGASSLAAAGTFNYNYIEGGFGQLDDGETVFANGAFDVNKNWGLVGGLALGNVDPDFDVTMLEAGAQFHQPLKSNLSLQAGLKLLYVKVEGDFTQTYNYGPPFGAVTYKVSADADDTGLVANVGLRFQVQPKLQLEGDAKLLVNDAIDDGLGLQGAVRYYFDPKLSVAGGLAIDTELDGLFVALRYDL